MASGRVQAVPMDSKTYSANNVTEFLSQVLDDVLAMGAGNHVLGCAWQYHFFTTVLASAQSTTRAVIEVVPQPGNESYIYIAEISNGVKTYKRIATSAIT